MSGHTIQTVLREFKRAGCGQTQRAMGKAILDLRAENQQLRDHLAVLRGAAEFRGEDETPVGPV